MNIPTHNESISPAARAAVISEALPYLRRFRGQTFVVKYGGAAMRNPALQQSVIEDIALLHYVGIRVVLVHGGGPEIDELLAQLGIERQFRDGLRVTDAETMAVVEMVLTGKVQRELVRLLGQAGAQAVGLSGKDGLLMSARQYERGGTHWGQTGEIVSVRPALLDLLREHDYLPVITSIAPDAQFVSYNINADSAAAAIAQSLGAAKLIFLTDTDGIYRETEGGERHYLQRLSPPDTRALIAEGVIAGGMRPKVEAALGSLSAGVGSVHILNGQRPHSLLLEIFTESGVGTMFSLS